MARMVGLEMLEAVACILLSLGGGRMWASLPCIILCMGSTVLLALARQGHPQQGGLQQLDPKPASGEVTGLHQRTAAAAAPKVRITCLGNTCIGDHRL